MTAVLPEVPDLAQSFQPGIAKTELPLKHSEYLNTAPGSLGTSHHQPGGATIQLTNSWKVEKSKTQS